MQVSCVQTECAEHCGKHTAVDLTVFQMGTSVTPTCAFMEPAWTYTKPTPAAVTRDTRADTATSVSLSVCVTKERIQRSLHHKATSSTTTSENNQTLTDVIVHVPLNGTERVRLNKIKPTKTRKRFLLLVVFTNAT